MKCVFFLLFALIFTICIVFTKRGPTAPLTVGILIAVEKTYGSIVVKTFPDLSSCQRIHVLLKNKTSLLSNSVLPMLPLHQYEYTANTLTFRDEKSLKTLSKKECQ